MKRLTGVAQHGWTDILHPEIAVSRFDHTIGTGLLTRLLGGSPEEQAAAFIHDISHTAFSHASDYLYPPEEGGSFHEKELPAFFKLHALSSGTRPPGCPWTYSRLTDDSRYSILEQPAPALCADRLDYLFRDALILGLIISSDVKSFLNNLVVYDGKIVCTDLQTAEHLSILYNEADILLWSKTEYLGYNAFGAYLVKKCLHESILSVSDLWKTDLFIIEKMKETKANGVNEGLKKLLGKPDFEINESEADVIIKSRRRYIDPLIFNADDLVLSSTLTGVCRNIRKSVESYGTIMYPLKLV
ncbi:MAG: HD domain-containing protein [Spirochaetales bacterium]|nr:HD domain-containing protein [Spirochaetales bacterium]